MKQLMFAIAMLGLVAAESQAASMPAYGAVGTINGASYSFTATTTGDIVAYFVGHTAGFVSELGLKVNNVDTGLYGLVNQTTAKGTSFTWSKSVTAGDTLTFVLKITGGGVQNPPQYVYSNPADNAPYDGVAGIQHIFSAAYDGTDSNFPGIPAGTYVGFEDLSFDVSKNIFGPFQPLGDRDYDDHMFVFTNVSVIDPNVDVPEPATMTMLGIGLAGMAGYRLRRRKTAAA